MPLSWGLNKWGDLVGGVIVHDWIEKTGGAEFVLEKMIESLRPSKVFSTWNDSPQNFDPQLVKESWLARSPLRGKKVASMPFLPNLWRNLPSEGIDWMLLSSHAFAHHASVSNLDIPKLGYIYSPARYVWFPEIDSRGSNPFIKAASSAIKPFDKHRAQEMEAVAGISLHIAGQIEKAWGINADVIYPPVDVEFFRSEHELDGNDYEIFDALPDVFILGASRFIPYKKLDIAIRLGELSDMPVVLAGDGPDKPRLEAIAKQSSANVTFVIKPSRELLAALYRKASIFSFPAFEDFGIMPIEAMASGTPVIGLNTGGVGETVKDGYSGALINELDDNSLLDGLHRVNRISSASCVKQSSLFSTDIFSTNISNWISENSR